MQDSIVTKQSFSRFQIFRLLPYNFDKKRQQK